MSITSIDTDPDRLTVTLIADFTASVERVWELWADPRKLERWWGPPDYPATFEKHDLVPGGEVTYFMTGPDGGRSHGLWRMTAVDPPTSLEFTDVFANADGTPISDMPVTEVSVHLTERDSGTRMETRQRFQSREDLEKWLDTGTLEGQQQAIAQMDVLLDL
ncbi:MAG TPA: SRPBCC domain-containing protein [Thermoleophilaceae bacterium]|nr:SRPBCC domain-containing protein [Thermoleophilaceae bacterium]